MHCVMAKIGVLAAVLVPSTLAAASLAAPSSVTEPDQEVIMRREGSRALQDDSSTAVLQLSRLCAQIARRGQCGVAEYGDICPDECTVHGLISNETTTGAPGVSLAIVSCPMLLALPDGCSHDLSAHDETVAAGTRVSDVCMGECSGHAGCAPSVLDVGFLNTLDDSSGNDNTIVLGGGACVDDGGVRFSGGGDFATATMGAAYASGGEFALALWLLKAPANVVDEYGSMEELYSNWIHPAAPDTWHHTGVILSVVRAGWLDAWMLDVELGVRTHRFALNILRDSIPIWTHLSIVVAPTIIEV